MNSKWLANQIICPYKCQSVVDPSRIQFHLVKCAAQNPHIKLEVCPFNSTHRFPIEEKEKHLDECPSRESFDRYLYDVCEQNAKPVEPINKPMPYKPKHDDDEEDWDHFDTPTYDPQKYAATANIVRIPVLMPPSQKRKFYADERKRLSNEFDRHELLNTAHTAPKSRI